MRSIISVRGPLERALIALFAIILAGTVDAAERIKPVPPSRLAAILADVPRPPASAIDLGLEMRLIDYIDCTSPSDPHDFRDQGTSRVVAGPAGRYRVSSGHKHGFFSYGYKTQGQDKPVLIVVEYPDDARRRFAFLTHDSMRPARAHHSFGLEGGVYTGGALPTSNHMQYFTLLHWPQDSWSPLLAMSYQRTGGGAAASRIWVYAVDAFHPLEVQPSGQENDRVLDMFFCLEFLSTRDNFGWNSPEAIDHLVDYCKMIGVNRVTMMLYANQESWGSKARIPAWDLPEDRGLDNILHRLDKKGGVGLIFGIVADGMYGEVKHQGRLVRNMDTDEKRRVLLEGFDQIVDRYGSYKSFHGFALGSLETIGFFDTLRDAGLVEEVVRHIKGRRPDLEVLTYLGCSHLQVPYFRPFEDRKRSRKYAAPTTREVVLGWEASGKPWDRYLGDTILNDWKAWGHDPAAMRAIPGLSVYEKKGPDDHRLVALYRNDPREAIYYDVANSPYKSRLVGSRNGAIFSLFDEGWTGLHQGHNFWYSKLWTAPDFNGSGPLALSPWTTLMAHRDRRVISAGSWTVKYFGMEAAMRRFAKAYRALPTHELRDVPLEALDTVKVRWLHQKGKRHVNIISRIPFASAVVVDAQTHRLAPFDIKTLVDGRGEPPNVSGEVPRAYLDWVAGRLHRYQRLLAEVKNLDEAAAPAVYAEVSEEASRLLDQGQVRAADLHLAYGLEEELRLRRDLLAPPAIPVPHVEQAPAWTGDLDTWPSMASDLRADTGEFLQAHTYFPNGWHGPKDLSARLRFAHDGKMLYLGIVVKDHDRTDKDACEVWLSHEKYRDWKTESVSPDIRWAPHVPSGEGKGGHGFHWKTTPVEGGYVLEGSAPLAELKLQPGGRIGFFLTVRDLDDEPGPDLRKPWAAKQILHYPYQPNFAAWQDARNCGELVLETRGE